MSKYRTRKRKEYWLEPENLVLIRYWRRHGCTVTETAKNMGVGESTLYKWSKDELDIREALKTGKETAIAAVENKLYSKALSGNLTAIIFYLKNNARSIYNDSQLSPEEIKQVKARTRKMIADARISEVKADIAEKMSDTSAEQLDRILDTLVDEVEADDVTKKSDDGKANTSSEKLSE
ncbi:small terminase subunit [Limosilactobacillus vaginalis]|uniref:small terminase subunit n=1 Tax=Limosilactobacillus vaginalis TaxID=1633 RepID=UPI0024BBACB2|nr:small terminase subunit [Limosilactobacillus vaginalis]